MKSLTRTTWRTRLLPGMRVAILAAALAAATAIIYAAWLRSTPAPPGHVPMPWWLLAGIFFIAEAYPVHLYLRREAHSLSLSDFGLVVGLYLAPPGQLLFAQLVGAGAAIILLRRQRPLKIVFNLALFGLTSSLALLVFHLPLLADIAYRPAGWGFALAAVGTSATAGVLLVAAAIRLAGGDAPIRGLPFVYGIALTSSIASASLGLAAVELLDVNAWAACVVVVPAATCAFALHAYTRQRRRNEHVEFLYQAMRAMQSAPELRTAIAELLEAARTMLAAEHAEIVLLAPRDEDPVLRGVLRGDSDMRLEPTDLSKADELALHAVSLNTDAILLTRARPAHVLDPYLAAHQVADAIVTAVRGEAGVTGLLLVGQRTGDVATFNADDRKLLETFANHAGVVLENDQVRERLRHQAFHDGLTGLPNRVLFTERVSEALAQPRESGTAPTVLFLDLDDFKTINDSLGHGAGDEVLLAIADRVRDCTGQGEVAARFGGDEFAILLPRATPERAETFALEVLERVGNPVPLRHRELSIFPTIGIAAAEHPGATAEEVLRNADVAMYSAKSNGKRRYAFYEHEMHARVTRRQELASALERAVDRDEIEVYFQPIVALADGRAVAFEALARWHHPDRGLLTPSSFIPIAEETGATKAIASIVLRRACRQIAEWRRAFAKEVLSVSVNLAAPELQNPMLFEEVAAILGDAGLAPEHLILEITESTALRDPDSTSKRLQELRQLGVKIALDDFGTGYSSLSYLRDLPIDFVKIPKPFIDALVGPDPDATLVTAMVQIAEALKLQIVAEGIEQRVQAEMLSRLNCLLGQGYHFSRPLNADDAAAYLRASAPDRLRDTVHVRPARRASRPAASSATVRS